MSFTVSPDRPVPNTEPLLTDFHSRGTLRSAIHAGLKEGPKNSFNVQPVDLWRVTVYITAQFIVRKTNAITQRIATAADIFRVGTPIFLLKARRGMRKSTHSPIIWPNLYSTQKRTMKYRQNCTRETVKRNGLPLTRVHWRIRSQQFRSLIVFENSATQGM